MTTNNNIYICRRSINEINRFLIETYHTYVTKVSAFENMPVVYYETTSNGTVKNIFAVRIDGKQATILNKFYIDSDASEIKLLLDTLSDEYGVTRLFFNKILSQPTDIDQLPCVKQFEILDNIALLPETFNDFINSLGKTTKKHSKYYLGRMQRDFPDIEYRVDENSDISKSDFDSIIAFSKERMAMKNLPYGGKGHDEWLFNNITKDCGFLSSVKVNGTIVAGCVGFVMGNHLYLSKIAHDPTFNNYNAGQVGLLKCIQWAIEQKGVSNFHFLWGKNVDYKDRFGGKPYPMYNYIVFKAKNIDYFRYRVKCRISEDKKAFMDSLRSNKSLLKLYHKLTYRIK